MRQNSLAYETTLSGLFLWQITFCIILYLKLEKSNQRGTAMQMNRFRCLSLQFLVLQPTSEQHNKGSSKKNGQYLSQKMHQPLRVHTEYDCDPTFVLLERGYSGFSPILFRGKIFSRICQSIEKIWFIHVVNISNSYLANISRIFAIHSLAAAYISALLFLNTLNESRKHVRCRKFCNKPCEALNVVTTKLVTFHFAHVLTWKLVTEFQADVSPQHLRRCSISSRKGTREHKTFSP